MNTIDEIKARIDIVDLVSETVKLRHSGKNYTGFCPFHPNARTPAFAVFPDSGTWRCFGQCNEGGDIFKYIMKKEGFDFTQALKYLAERAGVQLQPQTPETAAQTEEYDRLRTLLEEAVVFYRHQLLHTSAGQIALEYLHRRGLHDDTIEVFGLGYGPDAWEAATQYFTGKGYTPEELLQTGLATQRDAARGVYDRFRNRIIFPIREGSGKMAGFGARILDPNDQPKFINTAQTALFDKGRLLYGLDQARKAIRAQDQVVIVEGYLDVIALHQGGFANTVSPMGTALTEDQLRLVKKFTRRIILALDADAAGEKATLRGLDVARQAMDHAEELTFDPRGLLRHEARLQADLRVTTLPAGLDPDEVVNRDPTEWARILDDAKPVVVHVMETLAKDRDLDDPKVKSEIAARVLPLVDDVANPVERDAYRQRLARLLRVDERALLGARSLPAARTRRPFRGPTPSPDPLGGRSAVALQFASPAHTMETYCLGVLLRQPDLLYALDRWLQEGSLDRLTPTDFERTDHQIIFRLVQQSLEQDELEPQQYVFNHLDEALGELARSLSTPSGPDEPNQERLQEELNRRVIQLRLQRLNQNMNQLRYLEEDVQEQGDLRATPYQEVNLQYILERSRLDHALHLVSARR
ncbi:MAG: DNA primase [Anaerolineaceae bacterium]|nr:DNA primase [Anaerolineaceae bacterium]